MELPLTGRIIMERKLTLLSGVREKPHLGSIPQQKMKFNIFDIEGEIVKDNDTYILEDHTSLNNLVVSSTLLKPFQETRGHSHKGKEEVYFFIKGRGEMTIDDKTFSVSTEDVVTIPDGAFHKVKNLTGSYLYFVCVFEGNRDH